MPVYKYLKADRTDVIGSLLIRFSQPATLNDPYECAPVVKVDPKSFVERIIQGEITDVRSNLVLSNKEKKIKVRELENSRKIVLKRYRDEPDRLDGHLRDWMHGQINRDIGILSLSKRWDSSVMWAHYTSDHSGFVVGFDETHPFFSRQVDDPQDLGALRNVSYAKERVNIEWPHDHADEPFLLFRKNTDWSYEEEVRLVRGLEKHSAVAKRPNEQDAYLFKIPPAAIVSVIIGVNAKKDLRDKLNLHLSKNSELFHVRLFETKLSKTTFDMERTEIIRW